MPEEAINKKNKEEVQRSGSTDEEDESPEISEIEIKRLERDLQYLLDTDE